MRNPSLLDRQIELLRYLTGTELIFGGDKLFDVARDPSLRGISVPLLRLEAEMSFDKRMGKIGRALKQTFFHLGQQRQHLFREFVVACPPKSYRRYDDALSFYRFLQGYWKSNPPSPGFILDLGTLEIALARIKSFRNRENGTHLIPPQLNQRKPLMRLFPSVEILKMNYDLRPLFQSNSAKGLPMERENYLLVAQMDRGCGPRVMEITVEIADVLHRAREWISLEQVLNDIGTKRPGMKESLQTLLNGGVLETVY
jgi:hypothetical protein